MFLDATTNLPKKLDFKKKNALTKTVKAFFLTIKRLYRLTVQTETVRPIEQLLVIDYPFF